MTQQEGAKLSADTTVCYGISVKIDATLPTKNVSYLWNNATTNPQKTITLTDTYILTTKSKECSS